MSSEAPRIYKRDPNNTPPAHIQSFYDQMRKKGYPSQGGEIRKSKKVPKPLPEIDFEQSHDFEIGPNGALIFKTSA